jgi:UTP--glucose-1-phosphate uridylyltransferase
MVVEPEDAQRFGIATVEAVAGETDVVRITGLVEKPEPGSAPSNLAVIGRYVLQPEIYDALEATTPGKGGEIQLTDAMLRLAETGTAGGVLGVVFRGRRYDTGNPVDYFKAVVQLALARPDLGPELVPWIRDYVTEL